jgi:hypothetical protein
MDYADEHGFFFDRLAWDKWCGKLIRLDIVLNCTPLEKKSFPLACYLWMIAVSDRDSSSGLIKD